MLIKSTRHYTFSFDLDHNIISYHFRLTLHVPLARLLALGFQLLNFIFDYRPDLPILKKSISEDKGECL